MPACRKLYTEGLLGGKIAENDTGLDIDDIEAVYMHTGGNRFWVAENQLGHVVGMIGVQHHEEGRAKSAASASPRITAARALVRRFSKPP